jgi:1-acyl-sn-glycerol-3-phosphate acyltransferase
MTYFRPTAIYRLSRWIARRVLRTNFNAKIEGAEKVPKIGPVLLVANHQSYIDPPLIGAFIRHRTLSFLARAGLFKFKPVGWLIRSLNSVPIQENAGDVGAMKEILRRLDAGHAVLVFPEGSRTFDGAMVPFKRGVSLLIKRAKCPVVPIAIEGAFDAWPRTATWPRWFTGPVMVRFGDPVPSEIVLKSGAEAGLVELQTQIEAMRLELRQQIRAESKGAFPPKGPGDQMFVAAE